MSPKRLLVAAPLALLVAILAHLLGFHGSHQLGGEHGAALLFSTLAALAALLGIAVLTAGLSGHFTAAEATRRLRTALPASGEIGPFAACLFGGALLVFWALELVEGHGPFVAAWFLPVAGSLALAVALAVRPVLRWLARAGLALAALATELRLGFSPFFAPLDASGFLLVPSRRGGARRGRAPPR